MTPPFRLPLVCIASTTLASTLLIGGCGSSLSESDVDAAIFDSVSRSGYDGCVVEWEPGSHPGLSVPGTNVIGFGRIFDAVDERYTMGPDGTVWVERSMSGVLLVDREDGGRSRVPLAHYESSRAISVVEDGGDGGGGGTGWQVDSISAENGIGDGDFLINIDRVIVSWADEVVVFEDTNEMYRTDRLTFFPGDEVTVQAIVNDDDVVGVLQLLDEDTEVMDQVMMTASESGLVLETTYIAPLEPGRYFTYIDVFASDAFGDPGDMGDGDGAGDGPGTLGDYASAEWGMPYHVNANEQ
jgi:hypothetical protein